VDDESLLEPLVPGAQDIAAQVAYAARAEWALSAEDVLRRRTTLALRGLAEDPVRSKVEGLLGVRLSAGTPHPDG
jgi:glycerol-3-phosphate dehydrogenase